jgi:hypothetical protein
MNLTIDQSKLSGLNSIVARLNSVENAEQTTVKDYLVARINEILDSYTAQEIERIKIENVDFFNLAATLPSDAQEQVKNLIQQLSQSS